MKKWIAGLGIFLALSVGASGALAAGFGHGRNGATGSGYFGTQNEWIYQDANGDGVCDYCTQNGLCTGFVDTDGDGVCDDCRKNGLGAGFVDADHCARVLDGLENCTAGQKNAYCYSADAQALAEAHELGLSYGKYRAYLELQALDSSVTPQAVQDMSMREIRDRIDSMSQSLPQAHNYGENGQGKGQRRGATHANGAQQES